MTTTWPSVPNTRNMNDLDAWMDVELVPTIGPAGFDEEIAAIQLTITTLASTSFTSGTRERLAIKAANGYVTPDDREREYLQHLGRIHEAASRRQFMSPGTENTPELIMQALRKMPNPWEGARRPDHVPYRADGLWWVEAWDKALLDALGRAMPIPDVFLHPPVEGHEAVLEHRGSTRHKLEVVHVDLERHRTLYGCLECGTWVSDPESIGDRRGELSFWRARDEYPSWVPSV